MRSMIGASVGIGMAPVYTGGPEEREASHELEAGGASAERGRSRPRGRRPRLDWDHIKTLNGGKGRHWVIYCWKHGLTHDSRHGTANCNALTPEEKERYKDASPTNLMGGSTFNIDRWWKYDCDFKPNW